ncbi:MAG: hypothetical protein V4792_00855 [Pseudomonadota bacterium]
MNEGLGLATTDLLPNKEQMAVQVGQETDLVSRELFGTPIQEATMKVKRELNGTGCPKGG